MKRITLSLLTAALILSSCKEAPEEEPIDLGNYNNQETSYNENATPTYTNTNVSYDENQTNAMAQQMKADVTIDKNNKVAIRNFTAYGELLNQVRNLSTDPDLREEMSTEKAYKAFNTFKAEMPNYLKTRMVRKEVNDVDNALAHLNEALNNTESKDAYKLKHINKVKSAVEDLNSEIIDARSSLDKDPTIDYTAYKNFVDHVNYDKDYVVTIVDFPEYDTLTEDRMKMNNSSLEKKNDYATMLSNDFDNMLSNMPKYLKIDDVMDAVEDVQKEMKEYQDERLASDTSQKENMENLEEIDEALYDLNKELVKARNKYDDDRQNALNNYMNELNG